MNKYVLILVLLLTSFSVKSKLPQLSENSKVILFTCGPGNELYAGFGHSAIWVSDYTTGIDRLFNYGTFDFSTPNFYWKFIKGNLNYMLTVTSAQRFIAEYNYRKIEVNGQTLDLNLSEKQKLFELLEENIRPENRFYKYDFFYDNCATRIRDIVEKAIDGNVDFNTTDKHLSFRDMLFPYLTYTPWTKMGINLILGLASDKIATPNEYMYLPKYMQTEFGNATVTKAGKTRKLVKSMTQYLKPKLKFEYNILFDPALLFSAILMLIVLITFFEFRTKHYFKWLDIIFNSIAVIAGAFLFFMWVGTNHSATNQNLNILWLFPAQSLFLISFFHKGNQHKKIVWGAFGLIVLFSIIMNFWPQDTEITFLIITIIFAFRYLIHQRLLANKKPSN